MLVFPEWPNAPWYPIVRELELRSFLVTSPCYLSPEEPPPEAVTRLLEEFPDVFAELPKGLPKSRPTDHPIVVDETQTPPAHRLY